MLTADVRFEGWTVEEWMRLLALFRRDVGPAPAKTDAKGGVVVVHDGGRVLKLLHTKVGRLDLAGTKWPLPLEELAAEHHASWAVALHTGALDEVMERFGARAQRSDDVVQQAITVAHVVREMAVEGAIAAWPAHLRTLPVPRHGVVMRTLDSICPDGRSVVLGLFEGGELHTAIAIRRRGAGLDAVIGPDELRHEMGLLSGDWRRDYRHLARAVEARLSPLSAGLFAEVGTFRELAHSNVPGAWARAAALRDVVVSPMSTAVVIPLVFDALRGALASARTIGERYDPTGRLAPTLKLLAPKREDEEAEEKRPESTTRKLVRRLFAR